MIFYAYLWFMGIAVLLSLFNLRRGDIRLTGLAVSYMLIIAGFHWIAISWLQLQKTAEFPLLCAGAQMVIAYAAYQVGCRAAKIILPLAAIAISLNCFVFTINEYPSLWYFYSANIIQGCQVASLIFASTIWHGYAYSKNKVNKDFDVHMKRMSHERTG